MLVSLANDERALSAPDRTLSPLGQQYGVEENLTIAAGSSDHEMVPVVGRQKGWALNADSGIEGNRVVLKLGECPCWTTTTEELLKHHLLANGVGEVNPYLNRKVPCSEVDLWVVFGTIRRGDIVELTKWHDKGVPEHAVVNVSIRGHFEMTQGSGAVNAAVLK